MARDEGGPDADAQRQRTKFERRLAFVAEPWSWSWRKWRSRLLLLVGAGLFVRTLLNLQRVEPGFNTRNLLLFSVQPSLIGYKDEKLAQLYQQMAERLEAVPGVQAVTFSRIRLARPEFQSCSVFLRSALTAAPDAEGRIKRNGDGYINQCAKTFWKPWRFRCLPGALQSPGRRARAQGRRRQSNLCETVFPE